MKKIFVACMLMLLCGLAGAQKVYFIYMQSENNASFFVKLNDQVTSSNPSGYLILSKLVDSVYQFTVGKTGQAGAESRFSININRKDHGYLLRETDGKFSLFDLQSLTSLQPLASAVNSNGPVVKRTDAFTMLLAQAANDPSLLDVRSPITVAQTEGKKPEATPAVVITTKEPEKAVSEQHSGIVDSTEKKESDVAATPPEKKELVKDMVQPDSVQQRVSLKEPQPESTTQDETKPYKPSIVTRKSESSTSEGFGLTFLDEAEGAVDTIRIVIPNQATAMKAAETDDGDLKKFLNISIADSLKTDSAVPGITKTAAAKRKNQTACTAATDRDFLKLRKNMAAKENDAAMISEAQKAFKKSCFTTEQVKNLSSLFLTASGKYHFYDAAYDHVSNREQYSLLQTELDDAYYVTRFKALIANQ